MKTVTLVLTIADDMSDRGLEELKAAIFMWRGVARVDSGAELERLQQEIIDLRLQLAHYEVADEVEWLDE